MSASDTNLLSPAATLHAPRQPIARIDGLKVVGEKGRPLLEVEHLEIAPAQTIAIKGPSGAGKSTLLFALAGLADVSQGSIRWNVANIEMDLAQQSAEQNARFRRDHLGMIFQDFLLFEELDAVENASVANGYLPAKNQKALRARAEKILKDLGIKDVNKRSIASFSGGERQRVAIARALANDPNILLADEPTASLDRVAADRLIDDLMALVREQGKTLIVVSHDTQLCEKMDRILEVRDGKVFENILHENENVSSETMVSVTAGERS